MRIPAAVVLALSMKCYSAAAHINTSQRCKAEDLEVLTNITPTRGAETPRIPASAITHHHQRRQLVLILYLHFCWEIKCTLTQNTEHRQDNYHD